MRQLNILELFLDCITEPNERLIEFGIGGICNSCVDPANASVITQCGGIPLVVQCLSSPVRNTVNYALGALYYLCNPSTKKEILRPDVLRVIGDYATVGAVNSSFNNLANTFLDKHVNPWPLFRIAEVERRSYVGITTSVAVHPTAIINSSDMFCIQPLNLFKIQ